MASYQKTTKGYSVKLATPIKIRFTSDEVGKIFTKNGFTKYIHPIGSTVNWDEKRKIPIIIEHERPEIVKAETVLQRALSSISKKIGKSYEFRSSIITEYTKDCDGMLEPNREIIFLTIPKDSIKKMNSKSIQKISFTMTVTGLTLSDNGFAYPTFFTEFRVTENSEINVELDEEPEEDEEEPTPKPAPKPKPTIKKAAKKPVIKPVEPVEEPEEDEE